MELKIALLLILVGASNIFATTSYSQVAKVSLDLNNATLEEVMDKIESQSEFYFIFNQKQIDVNRVVSIQGENKLITEILPELFKGTNVNYAVLDRKILLTTDKLENGLLALASSEQQQKKITGSVTDKNGTPVIGANVVVTGTSQGTITDVTGKFSIDVPQDAKSLTFTFVGMDPLEVSLGTSTQLNVTMTESAIGLGEVVVIGYGTVKKSDITGSMSTITRDKFNSGLVMAPEQMMQGKVSGVNINLNSGEPGANSKVLIRGGTSINASNDPLYVIDGVPVAFDAGNFNLQATSRSTNVATNPLNMLNPSDIESINILKDASATAIYGSRGANGVIIITTKKGVAGKTSVEYEASVGVSSLRKKIDMLSAAQYRKFMSDNGVTSWVDGGASTDWQDQIFRTALTQTHNLGFSGGSNKTSYRASLNYTDQDGIIIASSLKKLTGRINISQAAINDKLHLNLFLTNSLVKNFSSLNPDGYGGEGSGGVIRDALRNDPTYPVKDANGKYTWHGVNMQNPVEESLVNTDNTESNRYLGNLTMDFKFTDWLSFNTNLGFTKENIGRYGYQPKSGRLGENVGGAATQQFRNNGSQLLEMGIVFNKTFGKHSINALGGYSWQDFQNTGNNISSNSFISDATTFWNLQGAPRANWNLGTYKSTHRLISFYGRVTYDFAGKYLITGTLRRDGSSRFGINNKYALFPSAAIGWRISEEQFLKGNNIISNLKLRGSYGVTGNQEIGEYGSIAILNAAGKYIINGVEVPAVGASNYPVPDLKWESTAQTDIGLDFGILKNRLSGTIDVYKKETSDLLLSFALPQPAVVGSTIANVGKVENKGIEFELNAVILSKGPVTWEAYGNISHNVNKVISLSNAIYKTEQIYADWAHIPGLTGIPSEIIKPGYSKNSFYGYKFLGFDAAGEYKLQDQNGDGVITDDKDRIILGNFDPKFVYGFGSKLTYKNFNLDLFFRGVQGVKIYNASMMDLQLVNRLYDGIASSPDGAHMNVNVDAISDGRGTHVPLKFCDQFIKDASYLRLENVTLSYNFNVSSVKWLSNLGLYLTGQNLFVITKYKGYDPEVNAGIDEMTYPRPRTVIMGVKVQF